MIVLNLILLSCDKARNRSSDKQKSNALEDNIISVLSDKENKKDGNSVNNRSDKKDEDDRSDRKNENEQNRDDKKSDESEHDGKEDNTKDTLSDANTDNSASGKVIKKQKADKSLLKAFKENNTEDALNLLSESNANLLIEDKTLLMISVEYKNYELVEALLSKGVDLDKQDTKGHTAIMIAAKENDKKMVELLKNANLDLQNKYGARAYDLSTEEHIKELLLPKQIKEERAKQKANSYAAQARVAKQKIDAIDSFITAVSSGDIEDAGLKLDNMVSLGLNVDSTKNDEDRAISIALTTGNTEMVDFLVKKGAEIDSSNFKMALSKKNPELIRACFSNIDSGFYRMKKLKESLYSHFRTSEVDYLNSIILAMNNEITDPNSQMFFGGLIKEILIDIPSMKPLTLDVLQRLFNGLDLSSHQNSYFTNGILGKIADAYKDSYEEMDKEAFNNAIRSSAYMEKVVFSFLDYTPEGDESLVHRYNVAKDINRDIILDSIEKRGSQDLVSLLKFSCYALDKEDIKIMILKDIFSIIFNEISIEDMNKIFEDSEFDDYERELFNEALWGDTGLFNIYNSQDNFDKRIRACRKIVGIKSVIKLLTGIEPKANEYYNKILK